MDQRSQARGRPEGGDGEAPEVEPAGGDPAAPLPRDGLGAPPAAGDPGPAGAEAGGKVRIGGGAARCPYCHDEVALEAPTWVACAGCLARHHGGCWREAGRCASCGGAESLARAARPTASGELGPLVERSAPPGALLGASRRLLLERTIEGEVGPEVEQDVMRLLLDRFGVAGTFARAGGLITWSATASQGFPRLVRVTVDAHAGRTVVRVEEDLTPLVGMLYGGLVGGLFGGLGGGLSPLLAVAGLGGVAVGVWIASCLLGSLALARSLHARLARARRAELAALADELALRLAPAAHRPRSAAKGVG